MPSVLDHFDLKPPRDGDGDGQVHDGLPHQHALATTPRPAPPQPATPEYREFGDAPAVRKAIYGHVLKAASAIKPSVNPRHTLELTDVGYEGPEEFSLAEQKKAVLEGGTLGRRLKGTFTLKDTATGETLDTKRTTVATVPYFTPRGTFVKNGSEYSLASQLRLKPGSYTRVKENGEIENHLNIRPGTGASHRVFMEPATGRFRLGMGQAKMPLLPLLRAMGASDANLREAWGNDLAHANMLHDDPTVIDKLHKRLVRAGDAEPAGGRGEAVANAFAAMPMDPEVNQATLGKPHDRVTLDALLDVTKKLIAVNKGEAKVDDRDDLAFMTLHGPEDLMAERVGRDRMVLGRVLWKASRTGSLKSLPPGLMTRAVESAITSSGLGQPIESVNPLQVYEQQGRVSRMGEGAIASLDAVPESSRNVNSSQFGYIDSLVTPESLKVGVDSRVASQTKKGLDGAIYSTAFRDLQGNQLTLTPSQASKRVIAFPGELASGEPYVAAMVGGRTKSVPRSQVDTEMGVMQHAYSPITNMVAMFSAVKPQRAVMAGRFITQALPLIDPESAHVQSGVPGEGQSYDRKNGEIMGALRSQDHGTVESTDADHIKVRTHDGRLIEHQIYNHFPSNRKTGTSQTATVRPGMPVKPGDLLARSNYTDGEGVSAMGKNTRIAYVPTGHNFEDAIEVSESYAKRLTSEHYYQHQLEHAADLHRGKKAHTAIFPGKYTKETLDKFDEDGVIKPGTEVQFDHPLVLAAKQRDRTYGLLHKGRQASFSDATELWNHHSPGVVTDVAKTAKGTTVVVKTHAPSQVGDKVAGRHGDKGVISRIVPDHEMMRDQNGVPFEVALNPLGTISRTNPSQHIEGALGKISALTGKKYTITDFDKVAIPDLTQFAKQELMKHGLDPDSVEPVFDPVKRRWIKDPFTGGHPQTANRYLMKLHHTSESKGQGRGTGTYSSEGTPAKGGETGAKRLSLMELNALLSHGAVGVGRDAGLIRGQSHPELWSRFMSGHSMPEPKVPHVFEKFFETLRAAGINPVRSGTKTHLTALSNSDVATLAGGRDIQNAETVDWNNGLRPVPGGLFDPALTGGAAGNRWSSLKLHEPMPNPVMMDPIMRVLGLTEKKFRDVLAGREKLGDATGPHAIRDALAAIDVDRAVAQAKADVVSGNKSTKDAAVRKWKYLAGVQKHGLHPRDWILDRAPILPPKFRPVSVMKGSGLPMVSDPNLLYAELFDANKNLADISGKVDDVGAEREAVYDALTGVVGLGEPINPKNQERQVKGVLKHIFGTSPKYGVIQRKLLGSTTDLVGRAVITPDPDLDMDEAGVPEDKAWEIYQPFLIRNLVRDGVPRMQAVQHVKGRTGLARDALVAEMGRRPIIVTRAPVLHRYGIMALRPKLSTGSTLKIPPMLCKGMGADFDGDAVSYHVPASDDAVSDAYEKMLPSRNLIAVSDFHAHQLPSQEYTGGLYTSSAAKTEGKRPRVFATRLDAVKAYERGEVGVGDPVHIVDHD